MSRLCRLCVVLLDSDAGVVLHECLELELFPDIRERAIRSLRERVQHNSDYDAVESIQLDSVRGVLAVIPTRYVRDHVPVSVHALDVCDRPYVIVSRAVAVERGEEFEGGEGRYSCKVDEELSGGAGLVVCVCVCCVFWAGDCGGGGLAYGCTGLGVVD